MPDVVPHSIAFILRQAARTLRLKPREALRPHERAMTDRTLKAEGLSRHRAPARADVLDAHYRRLIDADSAEAKTDVVTAETGRSRSSIRRARRTAEAAGTIAFQQATEFHPHPRTGAVVPWASPVRAHLTTAGRILRDALADLRARIIGGIAADRARRTAGEPRHTRTRREPQYESPMNLCKYLRLSNPYSRTASTISALAAA